MVLFTPRLATGLAAIIALAGCAAGGAARQSELDVSQLVRTEPTDLQVIDVLPRGLGSTRQAGLIIAVRDEDPRVSVREAFALRQSDERYEAEARRTLVTYELRPEDQTRFAQTMVRLRAQMLAGYAQVSLGAATGVCDEAGVSLAPGPLSTILRNAGTGRTILTIPPGEPVAAIKERAPFCT